MPVDNRELIRAMALIADDHNVRVTIQQTGKGAAICAASSFVGGLLLGPLGLAIGGAAGGVAAYRATQGCFRPLGDVLINDLTDRQKEQLIRHVNKAVEQFHPSDLAMLFSLMMTNNAVKQAVLNTVLSFVRNEMHMQIVD